MLTRILGKTDEEVSILGFGCMRLPKVNDSDEVDVDESIKQIRYAIDQGVTYIDTAYPYHGGQSEEIVGKALEDGYREKVKIATKLPPWMVNSREHMDEILNEQLEKLQTDTIDFYLIHALTKKRWNLALKYDVFDFLDKALASGKIKHVGFSFHDDYELFQEIVDSYDWEFCQIQFNFMDQDYQAGLKGMKYANEQGLGIIVMEPLRGGSLVNNIPDDIQQKWKTLDEDNSPAQWALKFIWNFEEVNVVLSGMNQMDHIQENIDMASRATPGSMTKKELRTINEIKNIYHDRIKVNCTRCQYCMPCTVGVDIPEAFTQYNNAFMFDDVDSAKFHYHILLGKHDKLASKCIECGQCEPKCPQNIKIIDRLKEVVDLLEE